LKQITILVVALLFCNQSFSQVDSTITDTTKSVYKGLTTKKFYGLSYAANVENYVTTYRIDGDLVDKATYNKYHDTWKNMETCKPCILLTYDFYDKLLYKAIQFTDCAVGYWIEYFPNGKVKTIGHFKENESENWANAFDSGLCRQDGIWTYFNEAGKKLYSEYWKDGQFLKQVPEQAKTELWAVDITFNGAQISKQTVTPKQVGEITITPKFKNSNRAGTNIKVTFEISTLGYKVVSETFSLDEFSKIDVQKLLLESGVPSTEKASCVIMINNNGRNAGTSWFYVQN
jgi:antitoxin component YwqK of YwqJK toxin-antitoxin module